jgi:hypothetical protein
VRIGLFLPVAQFPVQRRDPEEYAALLRRIHPVGTADDCVATLAAIAERTGIEHFVSWSKVPGIRL